MSGVLEHLVKESTPAKDAFRKRMESQCRQIEAYRLAQSREDGRVLSLDEAAKEWIALYAAAFVVDGDCP